MLSFLKQINIQFPQFKVVSYSQLNETSFDILLINKQYEILYIKTTNNQQEMKNFSLNDVNEIINLNPTYCDLHLYFEKLEQVFKNTPSLNEIIKKIKD